MNAKRIYRPYVEEGLIVRTRRRNELAQRQRLPQRRAMRSNERWSMDLVVQGLGDDHWMRMLAIIDQDTRECPDVETFFTLADGHPKLALWSHEYNNHRPHPAQADRTPTEFAAPSGGGNDGDKTAMENAACLPHSHSAAAAASDLTSVPVSRLLLEAIT
jgi:transposase InsO family protein